MFGDRPYAHDRRGPPGSLGSEMRKIFQEMQGKMENLQKMIDYAQEHDMTEIVKQLKKVYQSFDELKHRYHTGTAIKELQTASYLKKTPVTDKSIESIKNLLKAIHNDITLENTEAKAQMRELRSLLITSTDQVVNEHFKDFMTPRNQFVAFLDKVDSFEKTYKSKSAKNAPQFFTAKSNVNDIFPEIVPQTKLKPRG